MSEKVYREIVINWKHCELDIIFPSLHSFYSVDFSGVYEFSRTGQLLPILIGTTMEDPSGSGLQVPVLGAEKDKNSGKVRPSLFTSFYHCR